ncbi:hypothetical protein [Gilliamella sp. wkB292]|uniref:hypothetical protein n=1 Tax=Gilliamella sp. wkB292 TaxID=3120262 RepID=UPI001C400F24|nr:hypothetical protein [Gilliamella apicola]
MMIDKNELTQKMLVDQELEKEKIYPFFKQEFGVLDSAYILGAGIDQFEDIYTYLVNGKYVINFDVSRINQLITKNSIITVDEYKKSIQGKGRAKKESREYLDKIMKEIYTN